MVNVSDFSTSSFVLIDSIFTTKTIWTPIPSFSGVFDGNDNIIMGLNIQATETNVGIFAVNHGTIKDLTISEIFIENTSSAGFATENYYGLLVGYNTGTIDRVFVTGDIKYVNAYRTYIGGIVGYNAQGTIINSDVFGVDIDGSGYMGALVGGINGGTIENNFVENATINIYAVTKNPIAGGVVGYLKNATMTYSTVCDVDINFVSDGGIEHYIIAPQMGKIVGYMDNSHINYACMVRTTLDYGPLPERDRKNWLSSWHYPRQYIGAYGNGACGNKTSNSTISNENWMHPALQTRSLRNVSIKQRIEQLKSQNVEVFGAL